MACNRLLLLVLVVLCCFSNAATAARSLGVPEIGKDQNDQKVEDDLKIPNEDQFTGSDDLVAMDYTPASKKPPIHN